MNSRSWAEGLSDAFLFVVVTLPVALSLALAPFCSGWNEGSMSGTCSIEFIAGLYDFLNGIFLLLAFGGIIFVFPLIAIAIIVSTVAKLRKFKNGYRPDSVYGVMKEVVYVLPLLFIVYQLLAFFYFI